MPGPLHAPTVLFCYSFRYRNELTGRWVKARYKAERHEIAARHAEWEITGEPEYRPAVRRDGFAVEQPTAVRARATLERIATPNQRLTRTISRSDKVPSRT